MELCLLQYSVASHSRKGEMVKQKLVQTALEQGVCDLAFIQGCTGIHEPIRAGAGAVYQPALLQHEQQHAGGASNHAAGTLMCYTASRFRVQQLQSCWQDLPNSQHSMLFVEDLASGQFFTAIAASLHAVADQTHLKPLLSLWQLMQMLSTECPVVMAGQYTTASDLLPDLTSTTSDIHIHLCEPVHSTAGSSQSFFATACSPAYEVTLTNVQSLLAKASSAALQGTENAHTAVSRISPAGTEPSAIHADNQQHASRAPFSANDDTNSAKTEKCSIAEKLHVLVRAAMQERAGTETATRSGPSISSNSPDLVQHGASSSQPSGQHPGTANHAWSEPEHLPAHTSGRHVRLFANSATSTSCPMLAGESEIEPKPATPAHARLAGFQQLTQTSSGNLCFAGPLNTDTEVQQQLHCSEDTPLPLTPAPFQLQPRPMGQQPVDLNALRIMQLQRSISELSSGGADDASSAAAAAAAAAMTAELHARLCQQNPQHAMRQDEHDDRRHLDGSLHEISADDSCKDATEEEDCGAARSHSDTDTEDDTGLYAAAKQAPSDLKAAWSRLMQQPAEHKGTGRQSRSGRSSEERMASPGRLLKCLQSKTASDVEAQMQALRFKH